MRFVVRFLRHRGRIVPWRDVMNQGPRTGDLRIEECLDEELHRYIRTARLFDSDSVIYSSDGDEPAGVYAYRVRARGWRGVRAVVVGDRIIRFAGGEMGLRNAPGAILDAKIQESRANG